MQNIPVFIKADSVIGKIVDSYNQSANALPAIVRSMSANLILNLLNDKGENLAISNFASWEFVLENDFDDSTLPQLKINSGITQNNNVITIPLTETNTAGIVALLNNGEKAQVGAQLIGYATGETKPGFMLQFNMIIYNRRDGASAGPTTDVDGGYLTLAQFDAMRAAGYDFNFSADGENWHTTQNQSLDKYFRYKDKGAAETAWSVAIFIPTGKQGDPGAPGAPGADGITPHIDATTNHWMIGETDTEVNASGALWQIPRVWYTYSDSTLGEVNRLDDTVNVIESADRFDSLSGLKLKLQSASATISGNISLTVTLTDGATTESKAVVIAVGTAAAWQVVDLTGMTLRSGKLTITRDYSAATDTLKDGATVVTAVVTAVRYKELD